MRKHRHLWDCKPCGKRAYPTQARANEAIDNHTIYHSQRSRLPVRVYPCPYNDGVYHLTSSPERQTA